MFEFTPAPQRQDTVANPERPVFKEGLVGAQARFILGGDAVNPDNKNVEDLSDKNVVKFESRSYQQFDGASTYDRHDYWVKRTEKDFDSRYQAWITEITKGITSHKNLSSKLKILSQSTGINFENFTPEEAAKLYDRYFRNSTPSKITLPDGSVIEGIPSNVKKFVGDVLKSYKTPDGKVDHAALKANLSSIRWLADIFGKTAGEVVTQLIDAESKLITQPKEFMDEANRKEKVDNKDVLRTNRINTDEEKLLRFVWSHGKMERVVSTATSQTTGETPTTPPARPQPAQKPGLRWEYERLSRDKRTFPMQGAEQQFTNPQNIAESLRHTQPDRYGSMDLAALTQQVAADQIGLAEGLNQVGLTNERLTRLVVNALNNYERFIGKKYGIKAPQIEGVKVMPISGKTAELLNPSRNAFAFVMPHYFPMIFLDFEVINAEAQRIGANEWVSMTDENIGKLIGRLLLEINPHEYTHLLADIALWKLTRTEADGKETTEKILPGKVGIDINKPTKTTALAEDKIEMEFMSRGTGLMEAVTVELTNQWAKSLNGRLNIPAYKSERDVLHALIDMLAHEKNISGDAAFKEFVQGYFDPDGFRYLVEDLSGKSKDQTGKITFKRPHFMQIIYALMDFETENAARQHLQGCDYNLTLDFIKGTITSEQKQAIAALLQQISDKKTGAYLSPAAQKYLKTILSI